MVAAAARSVVPFLTKAVRPEQKFNAREDPDAREKSKRTWVMMNGQGVSLASAQPAR